MLFIQNSNRSIVFIAFHLCLVSSFPLISASCQVLYVPLSSISVIFTIPSLILVSVHFQFGSAHTIPSRVDSVPVRFPSVPCRAALVLFVSRHSVSVSSPLRAHHADSPPNRRVSSPVPSVSSLRVASPVRLESRHLPPFPSISCRTYPFHCCTALRSSVALRHKSAAPRF